MENLYIRVVDGQPTSHPAYESNLIEVFGTIPETWEPFLRVHEPNPSVYQVVSHDKHYYDKIDGIWQDVWPIYNLTESEKVALQQFTQNTWLQMPNASVYSAWIYNEEFNRFDPPVPMPTDGKHYYWSGTLNVWKEYPPYPDTGTKWHFDLYDEVWKE